MHTIRLECGACGYTYATEYDEAWVQTGGVKIVEGDTPFTKLELNVKKKGFSGSFPVDLYACPKCNMVILEE